MKYSSLESVAATLFAEVEDGITCLKFLDIGIKLKRWIGPIVLASGALEEQKKSVVEFLKTKELRETHFYNSLFILFHGQFERFIRDMCSSAIKIINDNVPDYKSLSPEIIKDNILQTGFAFTKVNEPLDYLPLDYNALARNIGTCHVDSASYTLNSELFGLFQSNVKSDSINTIFKKLRTNFDWDHLTKTNGLQKYFGLKSNREVNKSTKKEIDDLVQIRNRISHNGTSATEVTYEVVSRQLEFYKLFGEALLAYLKSEISKKYKIG